MKSFKLVFQIAACLFLIYSLHAGPITWSTPTQISGVTDVLGTGILQEAYTFGPSGIASTTINGVLFQPFVSNNLTSDTVGNVTLSTSGQVGGAAVGVFGSGSAPFTSLPAAYESMLASSDYENAVSGNATMTVTIAGLTTGASYQIEFWVNDSRGTVGPFRTETLTGTTTPWLAFNTGTEGGLGQFIVGTFSAVGATQAFTITGSDCCGATFANTAAQINGLEVIATPEPSSMAMLGLAALALGLARIRRR